MKNKSALIFARGGSKGVPRKNVRLAGGEPLISYSIKAALNSNVIERVYVSTDCSEIKKVSRNLGASVIDRPSDLAGDDSPELLSWKHAIEFLGDDLGDLFISLPATSPLRSAQDIRGAYYKFKSNESDIMFGITPSKSNPYLNMMKVNDDDLLEVAMGKNQFTRRQDVPELFDVCGIYIANPQYVIEATTIMAGSVSYYVIPEERSLDIDTEFEFRIADLLLRNML